MVDEITQQGQWLGDGALLVKGSKLVNSGTLRAAGLDLTVHELENRSRMESGGELNWQGRSGAIWVRCWQGMPR